MGEGSARHAGDRVCRTVRSVGEGTVPPVSAAHRAGAKGSGMRAVVIVIGVPVTAMR
jgi:hypothetical protein